MNSGQYKEISESCSFLALSPNYARPISSHNIFQIYFESDTEKKINGDNF